MGGVDFFIALLSLLLFPVLYFFLYFTYKFAIDKYPYDEQARKQNKLLTIYYKMQKTTIYQRESCEKWKKSMKMYSAFFWKLFIIVTPIACVLFVIYAVWLYKYPLYSLIGMGIYEVVNFIVVMINSYKAQYKI